ncbi:MAG: hypothetical protein GQ469_04080 [Methanosarcinales archaeon]|nr:hypothetical protein [Methanosarcinales archaeon]
MAKKLNKLYILTAISSTGSTHQHPPPGQRAGTPNTPASRSWGQDYEGA